MIKRRKNEDYKQRQQWGKVLAEGTELITLKIPNKDFQA